MVPGLRALRDRYEAVLLDLDGTLLDGRSKLTPRTHRAIRALVDAGFVVVLCTGRSLAGTRPTHEALGLDTAVVTYNGSWIGHLGQQPDHYIPIPDEHLGELFTHERDAVFAFRHHQEWKHTVMTEHPDHDSVATWFEQVVRAEEHHHLPSSDLLRISMFFCETQVPGADVEFVLSSRLPHPTRGALRIECFPLSMFPPYADSRLHLYEVQGWSSGKAEAFAWLEHRHGIPAARTIAIGDHRNDLTMLAGAGLAITPENGVAECQDRAHLTIGHHAQEGIAAWIEAGAPLAARRERRVEAERGA
ncbi:MAG: HAD family hydrolase [Planctomycetota bacterium]|nr:HAD family hydrolase [Planctomycetota bacterium]